MVDIEEVYVRDLYKKHKGSELYKGFYSIGKDLSRRWRGKCKEDQIDKFTDLI